MRYKLDDLGWLQFEWLIQSVLKAELGLAVESWGGSGDFGRDAYSKHSLRFPDPKIVAPGPFLFQAKFVYAANAAGADWIPALGRALGAEAKRIQQRKKNARWEEPAHYVLLTNCPLTTDAREKARQIISGVLPAVTVTSLGGHDICDALDRHKQIARSFPQLLGLRDLTALLAEVVNRDVLARSQMAVQQATEVAGVFVPTSAYDQALRVLQKHSFVVLEGPPEMGKTAIAWMITLVQLTSGWDALVCDGPNDIFRLYSPERSQVFVADDAFGRTEYDLSAAKQWERQLDKVLQLVDQKHWLIWTSRKHILERAKRDLDLQGKAERFPDPAEVLVDASLLSVREKALILYRHSKAMHPDDIAVRFIRGNAGTIVEHVSFTPERIRRFVKERVRELALAQAEGRISLETISREVAEAIQRPTERMQRAFRALPPEHKWLLISLLESGSWPELDAVESVYGFRCPPDPRLSFRDAVEELSQTFIRVHKVTPTNDFVLWMHPSYRDLVIDEVRRDASLERRFLEGASLAGIKLALSETGGAIGERQFPFMTNRDSWDVLLKRVQALPPALSVDECCELLVTLRSALTYAGSVTTTTALQACLAAACEATREDWNRSGKILAGKNLRAYSEATTALMPMPALPNLLPSWAANADSLRTETAERAVQLRALDVEEWVDFVDAVSQTEPRLVIQMDFPAAYSSEISMLLTKVSDEVDSDISGGPAELRSEASRMRSLGTALGNLSKYLGDQVELAKDLVIRIEGRADALEDEAKALDAEEDDSEDYSTDRDGRGFDIEGLFRDL